MGEPQRMAVPWPSPPRMRDAGDGAALSAASVPPAHNAQWCYRMLPLLSYCSFKLAVN